MKTNQIETYICEICGVSYGTKKDALECESRSISHDRGVKIGDYVFIMGGEETGFRAKVIGLGVRSMNWGGSQKNKYWHTVFIEAKPISMSVSIKLSYDEYEIEDYTV